MTVPGLPELWVTRAMERVIEWQGKPSALCFENGPEYFPVPWWHGPISIKLYCCCTSNLAGTRRIPMLSTQTALPVTNGSTCTMLIVLNRRCSEVAIAMAK